MIILPAVAAALPISIAAIPSHALTLDDGCIAGDRSFDRLVGDGEHAGRRFMSPQGCEAMLA
jgi:hypothetical protein